MICIARTLGAPEMVPTGSAARSASHTSSSGLSLPARHAVTLALGTSIRRTRINPLQQLAGGRGGKNTTLRTGD